MRTSELLASLSFRLLIVVMLVLVLVRFAQLFSGFTRYHTTQCTSSSSSLARSFIRV